MTTYRIKEVTWADGRKTFYMEKRLHDMDGDLYWDTFGDPEGYPTFNAAHTVVKKLTILGVEYHEVKGL